MKFIDFLSVKMLFGATVHKQLHVHEPDSVHRLSDSGRFVVDSKLCGNSYWFCEISLRCNPYNVAHFRNRNAF